MYDAALLAAVHKWLLALMQLYDDGGSYHQSDWELRLSCCSNATSTNPLTAIASTESNSS